MGRIINSILTQRLVGFVKILPPKKCTSFQITGCKPGACFTFSLQDEESLKGRKTECEVERQKSRINFRKKEHQSSFKGLNSALFFAWKLWLG